MKRHIVVLGAGYAGLAAARILGRALRHSSAYDVILVDRNDYHELKPKLPEAVGEWTDCQVQVPIRDTLVKLPVSFAQAQITGLDPQARWVLTDSGILRYWRLIWALGAQPDLLPGGQTIPGLAEIAIAPYSREQACRLRRQLGTLVRHAAALLGRAERRPFLTVVVAGGGFVGMEIAGELMDRLKSLTRRYGLAPQEPRVLLVESRSNLLGFDSRLSAAALKILRAKGVEVRLGVRLTEVRRDHVRLSDGSRVDSYIPVWTGGIRGNSLVAGSTLAMDEQDRIWVDAQLRAANQPEIYAVGDGARSRTLDHHPELGSSGQAAVDQGQAVARAILAEIEGRKPRPYRPRSRGTVVLLGHREAIARIGPWAPLRPVAPWLKQVPLIEHLWRLGGLRLVARHWHSTILPLLAPGCVDRHTLAGDGPVPVKSRCGGEK